MELVLTLRRGESVLLTFLIPVMVLVFFSLVDVLPTGTDDPVDFLLPGVLALSVMSTAMTGLAIATGFERSTGVLSRLAAHPAVAAATCSSAKLGAVLVIEALQVVLLLGVGAGPGVAAHRWARGGPGRRWSWPPSATPGIGLLMAGTLPALTTLAVANLVYVVLLFLGGVVVPIDDMPAALQVVSRALPAGALADITHGALGGDGTPAAAVGHPRRLGRGRAGRWRRGSSAGSRRASRQARPTPTSSGARDAAKPHEVAATRATLPHVPTGRGPRSGGPDGNKVGAEPLSPGDDDACRCDDASLARPPPGRRARGRGGAGAGRRAAAGGARPGARWADPSAPTTTDDDPTTTTTEPTTTTTERSTTTEAATTTRPRRPRPRPRRRRRRPTRRSDDDSGIDPAVAIGGALVLGLGALVVGVLIGTALGRRRSTGAPGPAPYGAPAGPPRAPVASTPPPPGPGADPRPGPRRAPHRPGPRPRHRPPPQPARRARRRP